MNWSKILLRLLLHFQTLDSLAVGEEDTDTIVTNGHGTTRFTITVTVHRDK